jgi:hypothetical protein
VTRLEGDVMKILQSNLWDIRSMRLEEFRLFDRRLGFERNNGILAEDGRLYNQNSTLSRES